MGQVLGAMQHPDASGVSSTRTAVPMAVCDIVLLTWNRKDLLEPCVERLFAHTSLPSRLLIVDNGSTDPDTLAYLAGLRGTPRMAVQVVRLPENGGIAAALNVGLRHTSAPWMCLLNNDVLVTAGWLEEMIRVAEADPAIGLVNPMSNEFNVGPAAGETIDELAKRRGQSRGGWLENWQAIGFCVLFSRAVLEEAGYWDEAMGSMYFEDTDFSLQVRRTGRICVIAEGAYVFHHKSATINRDPTRHEKFRASRERLYRKWSLSPPQRIAYVLPTVPAVAALSAARVRGLANQGHKVDVIGPVRATAAVRRHLLVRTRRVPEWAVWPATLARVLVKKKRFDRIIVYSPGLARLLRWARPLYKTAVQLEAGGRG